MTSSPEAIRDDYAKHGPVSDPGVYRPLYDDLPQNDIAALCAVVQGNLLHIFWAERYGEQPSAERKALVNARAMPQKLAHVQSVNTAPLTVPRELNQRMIGNCRDFSLMLASFLRHQGIPARARCGFGTYFLPDHYEDHWVCEYWNAAESRWVMVDAQLDAIQQETLQVDFDPLDVPHDRFIVAGAAWQMCRQGQEAPEKFGIFDMHGWGFIRGNLVRDALALRKIELLPWDFWAMMPPDDTAAITQDVELMDQLAQFTVTPDACYDALAAFSHDHLPAAAGWTADSTPQWSPTF